MRALAGVLRHGYYICTRIGQAPFFPTWVLLDCDLKVHGHRGNVATIVMMSVQPRPKKMLQPIGALWNR